MIPSHQSQLMDIRYRFEYDQSYSATALFEELFKDQLIIITERANTSEREAGVDFQLYKNFDDLLKGLDDLITDQFEEVDDLACYLDNGQVGITAKSSCDHANDYYCGITISGLNEDDQKKCIKHIEEVLNIKAD